MSEISYLDEFEAICRDSWGEAVMELEKKPEYQKVREKEIELINLLYEKLGGHELLNELIDTITDFPDLQKLEVYKRAFRDCIRLLNWFGLLKLEKSSE